MAYVLGVDGGNTKTDYLLHDLQGNLAGHVRAGTCSHEAIGMDGARREMDARIRELTEAAGIAREEIVAAAFGLAGIDQILQKEALTEIVHGLGFTNSIAMNDSFLGLKAGSPSGIGISSVNGTGTAAGGIDAYGSWMQVGGIGAASGDDAGGSYLANRTLRAAYDEVYRFGAKTALTGYLLTLLDCENPEDLHLMISIKYQFGRDVRGVDILRVLFQASEEGDGVAQGIVRDVAETLARSVAGCAARLRFDAPVPIVLIGSVWTKGRHQLMMDHFKEWFERLAGMECMLHLLREPPAVGSVLWALELATGEVPSQALRAQVLDSVKQISTGQ